MTQVRFVLLALTIFWSAMCLAQEPSQPVRLELPFTKQETSVEVIALPDSSLMVFHKTGNVWNTKAEFYFTKYNHKLEEIWSTSAPIPADYEYVRHYTEMPYTYMILSGDISDEYIIAKTNILNGKTETEKYELEDIDAIYEFNVLKENYFLIGHNQLSDKPVLLYLKPNDEKPKQLPSVYGDQSTFSDMLADPANERLDVVISESNGRVSRLQVKSFNPDGKLLNNQFILQKNDKNLLNAEITPGDSIQKILIGNYSTRDLRFTSGFFTSPVASTFEGVHFYSILQLKNFLKYMKPRREERNRAREMARVKAGKEPLNRYRVLLHDLISTPTSYILAGEAYYPQYRNNQGELQFDKRKLPSTQNEGYKKTHAFALGFDKEGNLLWDNTFKLKGVESFELVHTLEVGHHNGQVIMAYPEDDKITYHIMQEDRFDDKEHELKIKTYSEDEKTVFTEQSGIIKWYKNNFIAFGFQRIKPSDSEARNVFYLNKISF